MAGGDAGAHHDGRRRGEAKGARAGDDDDADGEEEREGKGSVLRRIRCLGTVPPAARAYQAMKVASARKRTHGVKTAATLSA